DAKQHCGLYEHPWILARCRTASQLTRNPNLSRRFPCSWRIDSGFLMLPVEPHDSASRLWLLRFLPYKKSCADQEVAGANVCRRVLREWSTDSASQRLHVETD